MLQTDSDVIPPKKQKISEEDEVKNWNHLPLEMKEIVVQNMDFITRVCLKLCSKSERDLVESVAPIPLRFETLAVNCDDDFEQEEDDEVDGEVWKPQHFNISEDLKFYQRGKIVTVTKHGKQRVIQCETRDDANELFYKYAYCFLFNRNVRIGNASCDDWSLKEELVPEGCFIQVESEYVVVYGHPWLNYIAPGVKTITSEVITPIDGLGQIPCVINAEELVISYSEITDDELVNFNASIIKIENTHNITEVGIMRLIKKWIDEDYPIGSEFVLMIDTDATVRHIFDGYQYKIRGEQEHDGDGDYDEYDVEVEIEMGPNKYFYFELYVSPGGWIIDASILAKKTIV